MATCSPAKDRRPTQHGLGRQAAAAGDFAVAEAALLETASGYRESGRPTFEAFVLVELAAVYHLSGRREELPRLAERAQALLTLEGVSAPQAAILQLAIELIESTPEDPAGLELFNACWQGPEDEGERR